MLTTLQKLGNWYRHRYRPRTISQNILNKVIGGLISSGNCRPPRKRTARDVYYELFWETKIKAQFETFWESAKAHTPPTEKLSCQNTFITDRWREETEEVRTKVTNAIDKHYETEVEVWKKKANIVNSPEGYQE